MLNVTSKKENLYISMQEGTANFFHHWTPDHPNKTDFFYLTLTDCHPLQALYSNY